jgi:CHRD domain-containing protein
VKKIALPLVVALLISLLVVGAAFAANGGVPLRASLTGAAETAGGDPDGSGSASIWLNYGQGMVCWDVTWENIDTPTAGHIHEAPVGVAGPVLIPLTDPDTGLFVASGCRSADPQVILEIIRDPGEYYVNLHNAAYPAGAIRGQLTRPGQP